MGKDLVQALSAKGADDRLIDFIIENGYFLQNFLSGDYKTTINTVGDRMYGTKGFSSNFDIGNFISYAKGEFQFEKAPDFVSYRVKSRQDILDILNDARRKRFFEEGRMSFRGQVQEYFLNRKLPNPFRQNKDGLEISILPGAYRGKKLNEPFSFSRRQSIIELLAEYLEPTQTDYYLSHDIFRAEQHYATQTEGLDISFDIETALFFSNYKYQLDANNRAYHKKIEKGSHQGVIYCFVFRDPPVKKTEFLIKDFSFFKTYSPLRILRQQCGLPLFSDYERNIAITDIDCVIYFDEDFECENLLEPRYMFPGRDEDKFYDKLMELKYELKDEDSLQEIVEYMY